MKTTARNIIAWLMRARGKAWDDIHRELPDFKSRRGLVAAVAATHSSILSDSVLGQLARNHTALSTVLNILNLYPGPSGALAQEKAKIEKELRVVEHLFAQRAQMVVDSMLETPANYRSRKGTSRN